MKKVEMKNILSALLSLVLVSCATSPGLKENEEEATQESQQADYDTYYLYQERKIPVQRMEGKYYVVFRATDSTRVASELTVAGATLSNVETLQDHSLLTVPDVREQVIRDGTKSVEDDHETGATAGGTFFNCKTATVEGDHEKVAATLSSVVYWSPYYKFDDGEEMVVTEMFTVELKTGQTSNDGAIGTRASVDPDHVARLEALAKENAVEMIGWNKYTPNCYRLACTNRSTGNALVMANLFYASGLFETAYPGQILNITFD
jgi:hypothetical protein